jgi:hypothetical protein
MAAKPESHVNHGDSPGEVAFDQSEHLQDIALQLHALVLAIESLERTLNERLSSRD